MGLCETKGNQNQNTTNIESLAQTPSNNLNTQIESIKSDNQEKTREDLSASKINNKIMKRAQSFGNNRILCHMSNMSTLSNTNNTKIFNGKIDDYLITKELGKGSYATVKLAVHKNTKNK